MQANNQVMTLVMTCDRAAQLIENMQGDAARALLLLQQANFEHGPMDLKMRMRHLYSMALYKKHNSTLDDLCEGLSDLEGNLQAAQTHGLDQLARQIGREMDDIRQRIEHRMAEIPQQYYTDELLETNWH